MTQILKEVNSDDILNMWMCWKCMRMADTGVFDVLYEGMWRLMKGCDFW
jgi:hypothetical protein